MKKKTLFSSFSSSTSRRESPKLKYLKLEAKSLKFTNCTKKSQKEEELWLFLIINNGRKLSTNLDFLPPAPPLLLLCETTINDCFWLLNKNISSTRKTLRITRMTTTTRTRLTIYPVEKKNQWIPSTWTQETVCWPQLCLKCTKSTSTRTLFIW